MGDSKGCHFGARDREGRTTEEKGKGTKYQHVELLVDEDLESVAESHPMSVFFSYLFLLISYYVHLAK